MLERAVTEIGIEKLGIGLERINPDDDQPYSNAQLQERFELISNYRIEEIDIWDLPIPQNFWQFIDTFIGYSCISID